MEVNGGGGRRVKREASPDRTRGVGFAERQGEGGRVVRGGGLGLGLARRVQIVYYLSRNGQLEHPHFMELSQFPKQQLRLKDVMERLTVLRGKGMPSLFSWSCKRSYKNGYVWNDLSENDIIYPADGAEYVLKGSELTPGCSERFQQLRISSRPAKPLPPRHQTEQEDEQEEVEEEEETDEDDQEVQEPEEHQNRHNRCSRGVSTDEIPNVLCKAVPRRGGAHHQTEIAVDDGSPPSSSSSDPPSAVEPAGLATRNSVFLNLIACGSTAAGIKGKKSGGNLQKKGLVSRIAARACRVEDGEEEEEADTFTTENARNGNLQSEEKQYFSGSIVEAMRSCAGEPAALKRSSSYNEESLRIQHNYRFAEISEIRVLLFRKR